MLRTSARSSTRTRSSRTWNQATEDDTDDADASVEEPEIIDADAIEEAEPVEDEPAAGESSSETGGAGGRGTPAVKPGSDAWAARLQSSDLLHFESSARGASGEAAGQPSVADLSMDLPIDSPHEVLEELEPVAEIKPLPPEPFEEGLEMLPTVEEMDGSGGSSAKGVTMPGGAKRASDEDEPERTKRAAERAQRQSRKEPESSRPGESPTEAEPVASPPKQAPVQRGKTGRGREYEVEELEVIDESESESPQMSEAEQREELDKLISSGLLKSWTLEELRTIVESNRSAVVMEDGVYRIKKELYAAAETEGQPTPGSRALREVADQAIRGPGDSPPPASPAAAAAGESGGIRDLIHEEDAFDLSKVISPEREGPAESRAGAKEQTIPLKLGRAGIDYDDFLSLYPRSSEPYDPHEVPGGGISSGFRRCRGAVPEETRGVSAGYHPGRDRGDRAEAPGFRWRSHSPSAC